MGRPRFTIYAVLVFVFTFTAPSHADYSGGSGTAPEPYEIGAVADWQYLMDTPTDWDKHFILTADLDLQDVALSPVGNDANNFTGVFDGNDHIIHNVDISTPETDYVGLFGYVGQNGHIATLGAENITIKGRNYVGGLAGYSNGGNVAACYTTGSVRGTSYVGGLIGKDNDGILTACYSTASVVGSGNYIGGLVGYAISGSVNVSYAVGAVGGNDYVGGLLGQCQGTVAASYATGAVTAEEVVGGLAGYNTGSIYSSYSTGFVSGSSLVGGFVGSESRTGHSYACFWDKDASGRTSSVGGEGKTTAEMQDPNTFISAGWDFTDEDGDLADWFMPENDYPQLTCDSWIWVKVPDISGMSLQDAAGTLTDIGLLVGSTDWATSEAVPPDHIISHYPMGGFKGAHGVTRIDLEISRATEFSAGDGSADDPYQIRTAAEWALLADSGGFWDDHLILMADIDFAGAAVSPIGGDGHSFFRGVFDGNGHVIRNIRVAASLYASHVGVFGGLDDSGRVCNLGVENVSVTGYEYVGGLVGYFGGRSISGCYVTGNVAGYNYVGGLFGQNREFGSDEVSNCYTAATVSGKRFVGGLAGESWAVPYRCYSTGLVNGETDVGGLVGYSPDELAFACFWDVNTSGQSSSDGGEGKTTAEMKDIETYPPTRWDFITKDLDPADWVMPENDYPRLAWEYWEYAEIPDVNGMPFEQAATAVKAAGFFVGSLSGIVSGTVPIGCIVQQSPLPDSNGIPGVTRVDMVVSYRDEFSDGNGTEEDPYRIATVCDWILLTDSPESWTEHFVMTNDLDLYGGEISAVGYIYGGVFDGNDHVVGNVVVLDVQEYPYAGLFEGLYSDGEIRNMRAKDIYIRGTDCSFLGIGCLVGINHGSITNCHASGWVESSNSYETAVGGLVGWNSGSITGSSASGWVGTGMYVGGLVGDNRSHIIACYADASIWGNAGYAGGLVGHNEGNIANSYATGSSTGDAYAGCMGGLVGYNEDRITACYATGWVYGQSRTGGLVGWDDSGTVTAGFWDMDTSGVTTSAGGEGKTSGQMQDPNTFVSAGWDFVDESVNGTEDIWSICEGTNYPRLVWQIPQADWVCPDGVGLEDFGYFGGYWGTSEAGPVNLDGEDGIGFGDLMIFCEQWLRGR